MKADYTLMAGYTPGVTDGEVTPNRLAGAYGLYYLDNQPVLLRAAELQYFRVPETRWAESVHRLREAGCNAISSYIPWGWHEPEPGRFDFDGTTHPQRNLGGFLRAIAEADLVFLARPGPFIYAELRGHGYPAWLPDAIPDALARRPDGRPERRRYDQVYALLHPAYLEQVRRWYTAVAAALRPFVNAPVVSWQLDNETGLMLANKVGKLDFNPDTVARYQAFLENRYEVESRLSREWQRPVTDFRQVQPPAAPQGHAELRDWQTFLEQHVAAYLAALRQIVAQQDLALPLVINESADYVSPQNPRVKAPLADFYGYDSYSKSTGGRSTADFPFAGSFHAARFRQFAQDARPLTCWELGIGWWDPRARVSTAATLQAIGAAVARGVRGYSLYVAQDGRDPSGDLYRFGALLDEDSRPAPKLETVTALQRYLADHEEELTASVEVNDAIAYIDYQPYSRFAPEDYLPFGAPATPDPQRYFAGRAFAGLWALLVTSGYNPVFVDLEAIADDALAEYPAALFPTRGYLDLDSYGKLVVFTLRGGTLVTYPEPVTRQDDGSPLKTTFLWPFQPTKRRCPDRVRLLGRLASHWLVSYHLWTRRRTQRRLPGALHLSDLFEPVLVGQAAPLKGAWLAPPAEPAVTALRGDYVVTHYPPAAATRAGCQALLADGSAVAGYRAQVRAGTSTVIGTLLGGAYVTSRYYGLDAQTRRALRQFAVGLFEDVVPRQVVPDDTLEVETVVRLSPDGGCLLFVINRLGRQVGTIRFPNPPALNLGESSSAQVEYSAFGSAVEAIDDGVRLDLAPEDVMVVRLW